jgi:putative two-component system response regulator
VCRRLKEDPRTALIPVTILTGLSDAEARQSGIEAGADDFLHKPFEYPLLRARLRTQLRIKRLTDQLESTEMVIFSMARWWRSRSLYRRTPQTDRRLRRAGRRGARSRARRRADRALRRDPPRHRQDRGARIDPRKPGKLDSKEQEELRRHAEYGAEIVAPMRFANEVAPIILSHHEHWDGRGYPRGLAGEAIPVGARIIAVVDAWDAMTTDRPYRPSLGETEALRRLRNGAGNQWDPKVVETFVELLQAGRLRCAELPGTSRRTATPRPRPRSSRVARHHRGGDARRAR